jgi:hypothetical protein
MTDRSGSRAPREPHSRPFRSRPSIRPDRHRLRATAPMLEPLEGRMLLARSSSATGAAPVDGPTPQQLGAAYRQVVQIQTSTLQALGNEYRRIEAAAAQLAARANPAIRRDRRILQQGAEIASRAEQGLDVARGVEDQNATKNKIYIPNHLFLFGLKAFLQSAQTLGTQLAGDARRSTNAAVRKLDALEAQLANPIAPRT